MAGLGAEPALRWSEPPTGESGLRPVSDRVIVIHSRAAQRVHRVHGARHAALGVALAMSGVSAWSAGTATWLDLVGLAGGLGVLVAFAVELRRDRRIQIGSEVAAHSHGVGWADVGAALVTAVEAWHLHHQGKHGLPVAYGFTAVVLLAVGVLHGRLSGRRRLRISPQGIDFRAGVWREVHVPWSDIVEMQGDGHRMVVRRRSEPAVTLDCATALNAPELMAALTSAATTYLGAQDAPAAGAASAATAPRSTPAVMPTVQAVAMGAGIAIVPAAIWSASLAGNLVWSPQVPWSALVAAAMLAILAVALRRADGFSAARGSVDTRVPQWYRRPYEWPWSTVSAVGVVTAGLAGVIVARRLSGMAMPELPDLVTASPGRAAVYMGAASVVAGAFEEVGFRGVMQARLTRDWGRGAAWSGVASVFAALHLGQPGFVYAAGAYVGTSLALSSLVAACGSVWPGAIAHVFADVLSFGLVMFLHTDAAQAFENVSPTALTAAIAVGGIVAAGVAALGVAKARARPRALDASGAGLRQSKAARASEYGGAASGGNQAMANDDAALTKSQGARQGAS